MFLGPRGKPSRSRPANSTVRPMCWAYGTDPAAYSLFRPPCGLGPFRKTLHPSTPAVRRPVHPDGYGRKPTRRRTPRRPRWTAASDTRPSTAHGARPDVLSRPRTFTGPTAEEPAPPTSYSGVPAESHHRTPGAPSRTDPGPPGQPRTPVRCARQPTLGVRSGSAGGLDRVHGLWPRRWGRCSLTQDSRSRVRRRVKVTSSTVSAP